MKSRSSHLGRVIGQLTLVLAFFLPLSSAQSEETEIPSLRYGFQLLNSHHFDAAETAFAAQEKNPTLASWARIGHALASEQLGKTSEALEALEGIDPLHPASLDAKVLRLRIQGKSMSEDERNVFKTQLRKSGREELLTAVLIMETEALLAENPEKAFLRYRELRPRLFLHPPLPLGAPQKSSEEIFSKLLHSLPPDAQLKARLFEIEQLLSEKQFDAAEKLSQNIPSSAWKSAEGALLRAKLLKSQGKSEDALQALRSFISSASSPQREPLLFELTKSAWNANKPALSRESAEQFLQLFPNSPSAPEIRYVHART